MKTLSLNADFVIEGYIDPTEPLRDEGPFGDHTGYYTLPKPFTSRSSSAKNSQPQRGCAHSVFIRAPTATTSLRLFSFRNMNPRQVRRCESANLGLDVGAQLAYSHFVA